MLADELHHRPRLSEQQKQALAAHLKSARGRMKTAELARRSGVSDRTISLLLNRALDNPRRDTIAKLAVATGRHPREWLTTLGMDISEEEVQELRQSAGTTGRLEDKIKHLETRLA